MDGHGSGAYTGPRDLIKSSLDVRIQMGGVRLAIRRLLGHFPQALYPAAATTRKAGDAFSSFAGQQQEVLE